MKWFRSNIRQGSRLALFALAIQFALSFGHCHAFAAPAAFASQPDTAPFALSSANFAAVFDAVSEAAQQQPASDHDSGKHSHDSCAICAIIVLAHAMLSATPPLLLLPQAIDFLYLTTDAEFIHLHSASVAFQPRAPPTS